MDWERPEFGGRRLMGKWFAYRMRREPVELSPIIPKNKKGSILNVIIDTEESPLIYILCEVEPTHVGISITATFIFPEATPDEYMEAHRQHYFEESSNMVYKAIPYLIKKTFGYTPDNETIIKSGLIVPPEH